MQAKLFQMPLRQYLRIGAFAGLILLFIPKAGIAQRSDASEKEKLAVQYYQNEKYEKARPMFADLFKGKPGSDYFYEYYLNTLLKLKAYSEAEEMLKKQINRYPDKLPYQIALGYVKDQQGKTKAADKTYDKVLEALPAKANKLKTIANTFQNRGVYDYAIQTFLEGRKLLQQEKAFSLALARLYRKQGDRPKKMFQSYVDALIQDPQSEGIIKKELQSLVMKPQPFNHFKSALLSAIQSHPNNQLLIDMLSWLFIQNKAFDQAFIQLKALQKRLNTNGQRLVELASVARKNQALTTAENIYRYLIEQGGSNPYYFRARQGVLDVQYDRITKLKDYTRKDLKSLEKAYEAFMADNRFSYTENGKVALRLAEIKALYLGKKDEAISLLQSLAEKSGRARQSLKAKALLAMGDYYLLKGQEADAQLTYTKVEKMREGNKLGNKATFRKAKLSFYKGNFDWAGSQLKILKGATSKMIANDALELDMLIKDNRGLDTTEIPLRIYARADMYLFKNQYKEAVKRLDSILTRFPGHNLTDEVYFAKAQVAEAQRNYDSATQLLKKVYEGYKNDILADDALYKAAKIQENRLKNPKKAKALYEILVTDYAGSIYQLKARDAYRRLRGDRIN